MPAGYLSREVALRSALATRGEKSGGQQARFAGDYRSWVRSSGAPEVAGVYDKTYAAMSGPSVLDPVTGLLAETARGGPSAGVRGRYRAGRAPAEHPWDRRTRP